MFLWGPWGTALHLHRDLGRFVLCLSSCGVGDGGPATAVLPQPASPLLPAALWGTGQRSSVGALQSPWLHMEWS